jgi:hypothetical protein
MKSFLTRNSREQGLRQKKISGQDGNEYTTAKLTGTLSDHVDGKKFSARKIHLLA